MVLYLLDLFYTTLSLAVVYTYCNNCQNTCFFAQDGNTGPLLNCTQQKVQWCNDAPYTLCCAAHSFVAPGKRIQAKKNKKSPF